jgi:hypothetical protein
VATVTADGSLVAERRDGPHANGSAR